MDVAIIGMAGRFPEAKSIDEFYENLRNGRDSVRPYSIKRLRDTTLEYRPDYELFGFLEDIDKFDHNFFNISLGEAQHMDPHQRLILELVHHTFENAGYNPDTFSGTETSIFLADANLEYERHAEKYDVTLSTGNLNPIMAGRIARHFNLRGNALMIDTACSSSLVAVHLAYNELKYKEADFALACGVNIKLFPGSKNPQSDVGISSPDGKTKSFSAEANGTGSGEAVACILLKPLKKAQQDGDIIHAVIKGSAVNQDAGLSGSITAPSSIAQAEVLQKAWKNAKIDPLSIRYIEAHGTGTKLGDPIEVQGIDKAFEKYTKEKKFCALSAVKSNIGHTNSAAGISSMIKAILSVKHKELFPSVHFDQPNPFIDFANSAVYVNTECQPWKLAENQHIRRAGVSSFGISGTNCHIVLEEANHQVTATSTIVENDSQKLSLMLSGKSDTALKANAKALKRYLETATEISLKDICFTLNGGRKHYDNRTHLQVGSREELITNLSEEHIAQKTTVNRPTEQLILVFSDTPITLQLLEILTTQNKIFKAGVEECEAQLNIATPKTQGFQEFTFQYALYELYKSYGLTSKAIVATGIGQLVVSVISGKLTLKKGIEKALLYKKVSSTDIYKRCRDLVQKLKGERVVFLQVGPPSEIVEELEKLRKSSQEFGLVTLEDKLSENEPEDVLSDLFKKLYLEGYSSDWGFFGKFQSGKRIEVPVYQFDPTRCWVKEHPVPNLQEWLYEVTWEKTTNEETILDISEGYALVFSEKETDCEQLFIALEKKGKKPIQVTFGAAYEQRDLTRYVVQINQKCDLLKLKAALIKEQINPKYLIHIAKTPAASNDIIELEHGLEAGVYFQYYLLQTFHEVLEKGMCQPIIITQYARSVMENDRVVASLGGLSHGLILGINEELPQAQPKCIDVDELSFTTHADVLVNQIISATSKVSTGIRKGESYAPLLKKQPTKPTQCKTSIVDNTYLITAGLSALGLELATSLSDQVKHIILLDAIDLPEQSQWLKVSKNQNDKCANTLKKLLDLEQKAESVTYYKVDLTDRLALDAIITTLKNKIEKIDKVFYLGETTKMKSFTLQDFEVFQKVLSSTVHGVMNLMGLLKEFAEKVILFTAHNAIIGIKEQAFFGAINVFIEELPIQKTIVKWPDFAQNEVANELEITNDETSEVLKIIMDHEANNIVSKVPPTLIGGNPYFNTEEVVQIVEEQVISEHAFVTPRSIEESVFEVPDGWSATQKTIAEIWYDVLKTKDVGLEEDFFDLGGHSLNGTQVLNRIKEKFGVEMEFDDLLEYATIESLADYVTGYAKEGSVISSEHVLAPVLTQPYYEASHAQKRLWIVDQLNDNLVAYNMSSSYQLKGDFKPEVFRSAMKALLDRHEILRTTFVSVNGELKQKVNEIDQFDLDLRTELLGDINWEAQLKNLIEEEVKVHFDLATGPLIRIKIYQISEDTYVLILNVHHIIGDGWSFNVLVSDLMYFYNTFRENKTSELAPLRIQYKDYTAWQNAQVNDLDFGNHTTYWKAQFQGQRPNLDISPNLRPQVKNYDAERVSFIMDEDTTQFLKAYSSDKNATLYMILLASIKALLYCYSGTEDITIGSPISGRNHPELENQIGLYLNTLAFRTKFKREDHFDQLLDKVKRQVLEGYKFQSYPLDCLINDLELTHDKSRNPLFDVGLTVNNFENDTNRSANSDAQNSLNSLQIESINYGYATVKADLWFHVNHLWNEIKINLDFDAVLFGKVFMQHFVEDYQYMMVLIMENRHVSLQVLKEKIMEKRQRKLEHKKEQLKSKNSELLKRIKSK